MGLVDYSDSDESETDKTPIRKPTTSTTKPSFKKIVDKSNTSKIRVNLPQPVTNTSNGEEPPNKRVKIGGGGFSDFMSSLPPPKNVGKSTAISKTTGLSNKTSIAPVSLKTGAAPGFSRELEPDLQDAEYKTKEDVSFDATIPSSSKPDIETIKPIGKPTMFRPLSVSRKPVKKKNFEKSRALPNETTKPPSTSQEPVQPIRKKISLFSMSAESLEPTESALEEGDGEYQPLFFGANLNDEEPQQELDEYQSIQDNTTSTTSQPLTQSLTTIASDLHLSASERRQLLGRGTKSNSKTLPASATKVINFNTDAEYAHNEHLRAAGEQVKHNPVRSIAPGKHNLKQLLNAASSQKEALEESFAKGRSNRAEAGSRYGW